MAQSSSLNNLVYLFDRPSQPIFRPKGPDSTVNFDVPANYFTDRYKPIASQVQIRFPGSTVIPVREITPPDITLPASLDKRTHFSEFNDFHRDCATSLINTLMGISNLDDFLSACVYIQQRVNPYLFIYALSVVMLHRNDTRNFRLPSHLCSFPELYVDGAVLSQIRTEGTIVPDGSRIVIEIPRDFTASDLDVEHRIAYFREDIGINLHHWHWHLVYPASGPSSIVNKDRRGELFYYMHQQILARYNIERFCNGLQRVGRFTSYRDPIPEGYFPKLDSLLASRVWPPRQANVPLRDVYREFDQMICSVEDLERWRDRIYDAVHRGGYYRGDNFVPFSETDGIDVLGNMVEACRNLNPNVNLYGNLHNQGHNMISFVHDPDGRFLEAAGVMYENTTAMRDPVFYRWHTSIQDIFEAYKNTLPPYTVQQLSFDGVRVTGADIIVEGGRNNVLQTMWQRSQSDLSRGMDFVPRGPVFASFVHLQHTPFTYRIVVENSGAQRIGTVRIFLAPRLDERNLAFRFREHKQFFIELDRFTTTLRAGSNTIERRSSDSSITVPFEQTFRPLDNAPTVGEEAENFNYCGCGWPDHVLIPRGTIDGYPCVLFVMVTNYQDDRVENSSMDVSSAGCDNAFSFCGVRNSRYPDRKAMGFPFDRLARAGVAILSQFLTPNMRTTDVQIRFTDRIVNGPTVVAQTTQNQGTTQTQQPTTNRPTTNTATRGQPTTNRTTSKKS